VSYTEINAGVNWSVTGNAVAVNAVNQCATKPQLAASSNGVAVLASGVLVTVVGGFFLSGPVRRRRRTSEIA
jgi:hypothetical protein